MTIRRTLLNSVLGTALTLGVVGCGNDFTKDYSTKLDGKPVSVSITFRRYVNKEDLTIHCYKIEGSGIYITSRAGEVDSNGNGIPDPTYIHIKTTDREKRILFNPNEVTFIGYRTSELPNMDVEKIKSSIEKIVLEVTKND